MSIASSLTILGNMLGPVVGGLVAGHYGITASFVVNSAMLLLLSVVVWKYLAEASPPSGEIPPSEIHVQ